jgi:hypothetical protein
MKDYLKRHAHWLAGITFFAAIYGLFLCVSYPTWHKYERLTHHGISTIGTVVKKEPENHRSIRYKYQVGATSYFGIASASLGHLPPFDAIRIGDRIPVTYLTEEPHISLAGQPRDAYLSWSGLLFVLSPAIGILLPLILLIRLLGKGSRRGQV